MARLRIKMEREYLLRIRKVVIAKKLNALKSIVIVSQEDHFVRLNVGVQIVKMFRFNKFPNYPFKIFIFHLF